MQISVFGIKANPHTQNGAERGGGIEDRMRLHKEKFHH